MRVTRERERERELERERERELEREGHTSSLPTHCSSIIM